MTPSHRNSPPNTKTCHFEQHKVNTLASPQKRVVATPDSDATQKKALSSFESLEHSLVAGQHLGSAIAKKDTGVGQSGEPPMAF